MTGQGRARRPHAERSPQGEHRTGEDTAKRTLDRSRRRATVAERDGGLRGLATGASLRARAKTPRGERLYAAAGRITSGKEVQKGRSPVWPAKPEGKRWKPEGARPAGGSMRRSRSERSTT